MIEDSEKEVFSRLDIAFARFLSQRTNLDRDKKQVFQLLLATLSQKQHQGHSCIKIDDADKNLLIASGLTTDNPFESSQTYPLVIIQNRLYLQRYWFYEDRLAKQIKHLAQIQYTVENLNNWLDRYFSECATETDWQREAAKIASQQAFCIITGGPGTGKTTTVCKILALLQELATEPLLIALAAPTGKAAMRLQEAIALNLANLDCPESLKEKIPKTAITLHRLLGAKPPSPYFKHDANSPLMFDLIVVDEASMVDLALMSKLVDALKPGARLILLGDKDQLASVESGAVLADLILALPENTIELKYSYRFDEGIKQLADAVNTQQYQVAWGMLSANTETVGLLESWQFLSYILNQREHYARKVKANASFAEIYQAFNRFQVLCSNRYGKYGILEINAVVERELFGQYYKHGLTSWYAGKPVMVMQNQPSLHLYNGDIGICLPDQELNGNLMVFFQRPDGTVRKYLPARLPTCETVFAMTIHKSQGSEFDDVLIVLPETVNPVLSKELLYTAITRAKRSIRVVTEEKVFAATLGKKIERVTGLLAYFNN